MKKISKDKIKKIKEGDFVLLKEVIGCLIGLHCGHVWEDGADFGFGAGVNAVNADELAEELYHLARQEEDGMLTSEQTAKVINNYKQKLKNGRE